MSYALRGRAGRESLIRLPRSGIQAGTEQVTGPWIPASRDEGRAMAVRVCGHAAVAQGAAGVRWRWPSKWCSAREQCSTISDHRVAKTRARLHQLVASPRARHTAERRAGRTVVVGLRRWSDQPALSAQDQQDIEEPVISCGQSPFLHHGSKGAAVPSRPQAAERQGEHGEADRLVTT